MAGDVISHIALPGLGLALLLKINPLAGAAATLLLGTVLIWHLQKKTGLAAENIIAVVFASSLGIGAAITPSEDLIEVLFGKFQDLSLTMFIMGILAILLIIVSIWRLNDLLFAGVSGCDWSQGRSPQSLFPSHLQPDCPCGTALHGSTAGGLPDYHPCRRGTPPDRQYVAFPVCILRRECRVSRNRLTAQQLCIPEIRPGTYYGYSRGTPLCGLPAENKLM